MTNYTIIPGTVVYIVNTFESLEWALNYQGGHGYHSNGDHTVCSCDLCMHKIYTYVTINCLSNTIKIDIFVLLLFPLCFTFVKV